MRLLKHWVRFLSVVLTVFLGLNACVPPNNTQNRAINKPQSQANNTYNQSHLQGFKTHNFNLPQNTELDDFVEITEASRPVPITVTTTRNLPKNMKASIPGFQINPIKFSHQHLQPPSDSELEQLKAIELQELEQWYDHLQKSLWEVLIKHQHQENESAHFQFLVERNLLTSGSASYLNFEAQYKTKETARLKKQNQQRADFKATVKQDLELIRSNLDKKYSSSNFSTQAVAETTAAAVGCAANPVVCGIAIIAGLVIIVGTAVVSAVSNNNPPPAQKPIPSSKPDINSRSVQQQLVVEAKNVPVTEVEQAPQLPPKLKNALEMMQDALRSLAQTEGEKALLLVTARDIFGVLGQVIPDFEPTRSSPSQCVDLPPTKNGQSFPSECHLGWVSAFSVPFLEDFADLKISQDDIDRRIRFSFVFSDNTDGTLSTWLSNMLSATDEYNTTQNKSRLVNFLKDKKVSITLESPLLCEQQIKTKFESDEIVSFKGLMSSKSFLFDGIYNVYLSYEDSSGNVIEKIVKSVNIAEFINKTSHDEEEKGFHPLKIGHITLAQQWLSQDSNSIHNTIGVGAENTRGDLVDLFIDKVGATECKQIYDAQCIDMSSLTYTGNHLFYPTGMYRFRAQYSKVESEHDGDYTPVKGFNVQDPRLSDKLESEADSDPEREYRFIVLHAVAGTFARIVDKPAETLLTAAYNPYQTFDETNLDTYRPAFLHFNGSSSYIPESPLTNDIANPPDLNLPNPPQDSNFESENNYSARFVQDVLIHSKGQIGTGLNQGDRPEITDYSAKNLMVDLHNSHGLNQPYDAFKSLNFNKCDNPDKYLSIGAIVDLTSPVFEHNKPLWKAPGDDASLPLQLVVIDTQTGNNVLDKPIGFSAKIGAHTVFQTYWPAPKDGNYEIRVGLDHESLGFNNYRNEYRSIYLDSVSAKYDNAKILYPNISTASSNVKLNVTSDNCINYCSELASLAFPLQQVKTEIAAINPLDTFKLTSTDDTPPIQIAQGTHYGLEKYVDKFIENCKNCSLEEVLFNSKFIHRNSLKLLEYPFYAGKDNEKFRLFKSAVFSNIVASAALIKGTLNDSEQLQSTKVLLDSINQKNFMISSDFNPGGIDFYKAEPYGFELYELENDLKKLLLDTEAILFHISSDLSSASQEKQQSYIDITQNLIDESERIANRLDQILFSFKTQSLTGIISTGYVLIAGATLVTAYALNSVLQHINKNQKKYKAQSSSPQPSPPPDDNSKTINYLLSQSTLALQIIAAYQVYNSLDFQTGNVLSSTKIGHQWLTECFGDTDNCAKFMNALGLDPNVIGMQDHEKLKTTIDDYWQNGGFEIPPRENPFTGNKEKVTTLQAPGKPLVIPKDQVIPGVTHHPILMYVQDLLRYESNINALNEDNFRGTFTEALTRWHMEPIVNFIFGSKTKISGMVTVQEKGFSKQDVDHIVYEELDPNIYGLGPKGEQPIKIYGVGESKARFKTSDLMQQLIMRYKQFEEYQRSNVQIKIFSEPNKKQRYYIRELALKSEFFHFGTHPFDKAGNLDIIHTNNNLIGDEKNIKANDSGNMKKLSEWYFNKKVHLLKTPELEQDLLNLINDFRYIYGYTPS